MTDLDKLLQMASADNISDELLAAYIDGNTTAEENEMIQASMPIEDLDDIKEIAQDSLSFEEQLHFYDGDYGYWELGIPPVLDHHSDSELMDIASPRYDNIFSSADNGNPFAKKSQDTSTHSYVDEEGVQEDEQFTEDDDIEELLEDED